MTDDTTVVSTSPTVVEAALARIRENVGTSDLGFFEVAMHDSLIDNRSGVSLRFQQARGRCEVWLRDLNGGTIVHLRALDDRHAAAILRDVCHLGALGDIPQTRREILEAIADRINDDIVARRAWTHRTYRPLGFAY